MFAGADSLASRRLSTKSSLRVNKFANAQAHSNNSLRFASQSMSAVWVSAVNTAHQKRRRSKHALDLFQVVLYFACVFVALTSHLFYVRQFTTNNNNNTLVVVVVAPLRLRTKSIERKTSISEHDKHTVLPYKFVYLCVYC